jgi:ankyrin repeat protein
VRYLNQQAQLGVEKAQLAVIENDLEAIKQSVPEKSQRPPLTFRNDEHSPLRLAVRRGNVPVVKLLLERKVAVNEYVSTLMPPYVPPGTELSVLSEAIFLGNVEIVRLLIEAGATLEEPQTMLVPTTADATYQGKKVNDLLNSFWLNVLVGDADYQRLAAEKEALFQELLAKKLVHSVEVPEANANCPLAKAIFSGRAGVVAALLEGGADPNVSIGGKTHPLQIAVQTGHPGIVKLLIDAGADVNASDADGRTPLALGFYKGDIADMLRAVGAKEPLGIARDN